MPDLEIRTAASAPGGSRWLRLRVLGLVVLGGVLLLVISLPGLANEDQQSRPGLGVYVVLALVLAGVTSRTYVVVRRSGVAKLRALLVAIAVVPGSYCVAVLIFFLIVYLFSS
jgi:hypothetical protein